LVCSTGPDRVVDFRDFEFPALAEAVRKQALLINPAVNRIAGHSEVSHDLLDRRPPFAGRGRLIPGLILHETVNRYGYYGKKS
jgi:hypothetical protein